MPVIDYTPQLGPVEVVMTKHFAVLVGAGAVAAAVAWAPLAAAEPNQRTKESCNSAGQFSTVCQSPGDVEMIHTPPPIAYSPYGSPPPMAG